MFTSRVALLMAIAASALVVGGARAQPARSFWPTEVLVPPKFTPGPFRPADFAPPFPEMVAAGDGKWLAVLDPDAETAPPLAFKTTVHADPKLGFMQVAILALDLSRLDLALVAGSVEPESTTVPAARRPGVVPAARLPSLFAAFNGGFRPVHGRWGIKVDGDLLLPPKDDACTVVLDRDGSLRIATWTAIADREKLATYRQTPPCLVEAGKVTAASEADTRGQVYGASVTGEVMIRRSALGLDASGKVLFYGLGEGVTPKVLARAMQAAGAVSSAQLDVNYSFPRFLFYAHPTPGRPPVVKGPFTGGVQYRASEYVGAAEPRDFFYLARKR